MANERFGRYWKTSHQPCPSFTNPKPMFGTINVVQRFFLALLVSNVAIFGVQ